MCWNMKVTATVAVNLAARMYTDVADVFCKLFGSWCPVRTRSQVNGTIQHELENVPWFRNVDRRTAEAILKEICRNGEFLIRPSSKTENVCGLSVWQDGKVYHINVRRRSDGFLALGTSKPNENCFSNVADIVQCYKTERLLINSSGNRAHTILVESCDIS